MSSEPTRPAPIPGARDDAGGGGGGDPPGLAAAFTLVVWVACVVVGVAGLASQPAAPPRPPASQPAPLVVSVELESEPPPEPSPAAEQPAAAAPEEEVAAVPTAVPPSAAVAFAVPVAGPARGGPAAAATPVRGPAGPVVRQLTYGRGEGRQPAPEYPPDAAAAGQQGRVVVRFDVDAGGRVTDAWAAGPSPFPLLNRSAVAAVRDGWRFGPGPARAFEVPITFQLAPRG